MCVMVRAIFVMGWIIIKLNVETDLFLVKNVTDLSINYSTWITELCSANSFFREFSKNQA